MNSIFSGMKPRFSPPALVAVVVAAVLGVGLSPRAAGAADLGTAELLIAGTRLTIDPPRQTVPYDTPSVVRTRLEGYDTGRGTLPPSFKVVADFSGPEIDGVLRLETSPNEPFRIPRLSLKGDYRLDNIRLVDGDTLLAFAEPRAAEVLVTQILITRVTSRPLTTDEIRSRGIVVDEENFRPFTFTFGFAVASGQVVEVTKDGAEPEENGDLVDQLIVGRFPSFPSDYPQISRPEPFVPPTVVMTELAFGGCLSGSCGSSRLPAIPAAIVLPFDNVVLDQFFSVMLLAQNGAPAGDRLAIRDLTAKIDLPVGLRPARTEPPTPLGVPVPVRAPGADGRLGTPDDDGTLGGQETGQAEFLVEGLREGNHLVDIDLEGTLDGLSTGAIARLEGHAQGAVLVRNPTFGVVLQHPRRVAANQEYFLRLSLTNTSANALANLVRVTLPIAGVAGAEVIGPNQFTIDTLRPGETRVLKFHLRSRVEGRVVATAVRAGADVSAAIQLTNTVGRMGGDVAPNAIALPAEAEALPAALVDELLGFLGEAYTVATTPRSALGATLPAVSRSAVEVRTAALGRAGRYYTLGEELFDAIALLAGEWTGARDELFDWDELRRATPEGARLGFAFSTVVAEEAAATSPSAAFGRFFDNLVDLAPTAGVLAVGPGVELEVADRVTGTRLAGTGVDAGRARTLPFADLYGLDDGQMAFLARPAADGYQIRLRARQGGSPELEIVLPTAGGGLGRVRFPNLPALAPTGLLVADFAPGDDSVVVTVDSNGDGVVDEETTAPVEPLATRPFRAEAAFLNGFVDGSAHVVDVLFSREVDLHSLLPLAESRFRLPGRTSNGGLTAGEERRLESAGTTRIVRVVFDNPISPFIAQDLTVDDVIAVGGARIDDQTVPIHSNITTPGIAVSGRVIGPDGAPLPLSVVELYEFERSDLPTGEACVRLRTAAVRANAQGEYHFDYVRQTGCDGEFHLRAVDAEATVEGTVRDRVRTANETVRIDIVMHGRGVVRGQVRYADGTVPKGSLTAFHQVLGQGKSARLDDHGNYELRGIPVGTISLVARDDDGEFVAATIEMPQAGAVVTKDLVILPAPELVLGGLRGRVLEADGVSPVPNTPVVVYSSLWFYTTYTVTDGEGRYAFEALPPGGVQLTANPYGLGRRGGQAFATVVSDSVTEADLLIANERATVEGHVYLDAGGRLEPLAGAIVWVDGTPYHTTTDAAGSYRIEGVPIGDYRVGAIDAEQTMRIYAEVSLTGDGQTVTRDLTFRPLLHNAAITGVFLDEAGQPIVDGIVHVQAGATTWLGEARTDPSGHFELTGYGPGTYKVHGIKGSAGAVGVVDVLASGQTAFVNLRVQRGTVRGQARARQEDGSFVGVRAFVSYQVPTIKYGLVRLWDTQLIETGDDGRFEIADQLIGDFVLDVRNPFYGTKSASGQWTSHGDTQEFTFDFEPNGTIRGVVRNFDGLPVAGAKVNLGHPSFTSFEVTTDENGAFRFELVPPAPGRFPIDAFYESGGVFRKARIWVEFKRRGQILDTELELPRQGQVQGWVENQFGQRMAGLTVSLQEGSYPSRRLQQVSDPTGSFSFTNVFAGPVSVTVESVDRGTGGKAMGQLLDENQSLTFRIPVRINVGILRGRVLSPVDGSLVGSVQLELRRLSTFAREAQVATAGGEFEFVALEAGAYDLTAFDPRSGRAGRIARIDLAAAETLDRTLVLEARGSVAGQLTDPDSGRGVPAETVRLETQGIQYFRTFASTDAQGAFEFEGIPQGPFQLSANESLGRRNASAAGEITREDEVVTQNLAWQATTTVSGRVLESDGLTLYGRPSTVGLFESPQPWDGYPGRNIAGTSANPFRLPGLVQGRSYAVEAIEQGGSHRGRSTGFATVGEAHRTTDVRMVGLATVAVRVDDSFGNPLPGAAVTLAANGFYGQRFLQASTDANGTATFLQVGEGSLSVTARHPVSNLRGSASAQVRFDGQTVPVVVTLEDTGRVFGRVLRSDGTTPAVQTLVSLRMTSGGSRELLDFSDPDGAFEFSAVPLGAFTLDFVENGAPGANFRTGAVTANGQDVDFGTVLLDDAPPAVDSVTPAPGAIGQPIATAVTIRMSEPIDVATAAGVELRKTGATSATSVTRQWSDGNRTLTLVPSAVLDSLTSYQVRVPNTLKDLANRRLASTFQSSFTTADGHPPTVTFVSPANGAVNVPVDVQLRVVFSEPLDATSLSSAVQLVRLGDGAPVTVAVRLETNGREVLIDQIQPLTPEVQYRLTVEGVRDVAGNVMAGTTQTTFRTVDVTAPILVPIYPGQDLVVLSGEELYVSTYAEDDFQLTLVKFVLGGQVRSFPLTNTGSRQVYLSHVFVAPFVEEPQTLTLRYEAQDAAGNTTVLERTVRVEPVFDPNRPTLDVLCPGERIVLAPGTGLDLSLRVADDQGVERVELYLGDATAPLVVQTQPPPSLTLRFTLPASVTPDQELPLRIVARDFAGGRTEKRVTVKVVSAFVFPSSTTVDENNFSYEGRSVVVAGGTLTLNGLHNFRDLVILGGAKVTHPQATAATPKSLEVVASAEVYVACGGTLDVAARGTEPRTLPTPADLEGGSHGGRGGRYGAAGAVDDSPFEPRRAAQGSASAGGGGIARISAGGSIRVDGALSANGAGGAAGGSVRLETPVLAGLGTISADGGGSGGGGRIALYVGSVDAGLASRITARGGALSGSSAVPANQGAAGTVFTKKTGDTFGELWFDNGGRVATPPVQVSALPGVGTGTVDAVTGAVVTDLEASFPAGLEGLWVEFGGDPARLYRIVARTATTLTLDAGTAPLPVTVGETYRGVLRLDRFVVRGAAHAMTVDDVRTPDGGVSIAAGSSFLNTPGAAPTISLTVDPPTVLYGDQTLRPHATASDDSGLLRVEIVATGALTGQVATIPAGAASASVDGQFTLGHVTAAGQITLTTRASDVYRRVTTTTTTIATGPDPVPPTLVSHEPADGATVTAGSAVTVSAELTDNVHLSSVTFGWNGQTKTFPPNPVGVLEWTVTAPAVTAPTPFPVTLQGTDSYGNVGSYSFTLIVEPLANATVPVVAIPCPSPNAPMAVTAGLDVQVEASDDDAVERVEVYLGDTLVATDRLAPYVVTVAPPVGTAPGTILTARAVAYDYAGNHAEATVPLRTVGGFVVSASTTVTASDFGLDGTAVIVAGETTRVTIDGTHSFQNLIVLDGASVLHSPATTSGALGKSLTLNVAGEVYVACGGRIDADFAGYPGSRTYPNVVGGNSHGGRSNSSTSGPATYGSVYSPLEPGAFSGGGVVNLTVGGAVVVDGLVDASGDRSWVPNNGAGSGGTVRIAAQSIAGRGAIAANGGTAAASGGGRVALLADTVDADLLTRVTAYGRGAGTVFVKRAADVWGELIVDAGERQPTLLTDLVPVGRGTIGTATATSLTDPAQQFRFSTVGAHVAVAGDLDHLWRIGSHGHLANTLTFAAGEAPFTGTTGQSYEGVYRFDRVTVRGGAHLFLTDRLLSTEAPVVAEGSTLVEGSNPTAPPQAALNIKPGPGLLEGQQAVLYLAGSSAAGLDRFAVTVTGPGAGSYAFELNGELQQVYAVSVPVPGDAAGQTVAATLTVTDTAGRTTTTTRSWVVEPDTQAPRITLYRPFEGTQSQALERVEFSAAARDDVGVAAFTVEFGLIRQDVRGDFYSDQILAPPVSAPTNVPMTFVARDAAGNETRVIRRVRVLPKADGVPPTIRLDCPGATTQVLAGQRLPIQFTASDDTYVVEAFLGDGTEPVARSLFGRDALDVAIPAGLAAGSPVTIRLRATDFGANTAETSLVATVVAGTLVTADRILAADDSSLDGQDVVVSGDATLTVQGPHAFHSLRVLNGAEVAHLATDTTTTRRLELTVAQDVYVSCSSTLSADGLGYRGGPNLQTPAYTYPNVPSSDAGGSHGGTGGFGPIVYDSVFDPREPGGGGAAYRFGSFSTTYPGGDGGGVVRLAAAGTLVVDGRISANATGNGNGSGGAGGAIRLDAAAIGGTGVIQALGGSSYQFTSGTGGGGRIALYAGTIDPGLLLRTSAAAGAKTSAASTFHRGSAGTIFVHRDGDALGELIVDNHHPTATSNPSTRPTVLPRIGGGYLDAVGASAVTDSEAAFGHDVAGAEVQFSDLSSALWRITGVADGATTLALDVASRPLTAQVGDAYRGVWRFDRVTVRGQAVVQPADLVVVTTPVSVEAGSSWQPSTNRGGPRLDPARLRLDLGTFGLTLVGDPGAVVDPELPVRLEIRRDLDGSILEAEVAADGSVAVPITGQVGETYRVVAFDSGQPSLGSQALPLGPLTGANTSRIVGGGDSLAIGTSLVAVCDSCRVTPETQANFNLSLYDLTAGSDPVAAFSLLPSYADPVLDRCTESMSVGFDRCFELGDDPACYVGPDAGYTRCYEGFACAAAVPVCFAECATQSAPASCAEACTAAEERCASFPPLPTNDIEVGEVPWTVDDMAVGDGALVIAQGPWVRVVDVRDPHRPILHDATQAIELVPGVPVVWNGWPGWSLAVEGGVAHLVKRGTPNTYFAIDIHDPQHPRVINRFDLAIRPANDIAVKDGLLHVVSGGTGAAAEYRLFAVGEPGAAPLLRTASGLGASSRRGSQLALVDDVAAYTQENGSGLYSFHRGQRSTEAPHASTFEFWTRAVAEVGDHLFVAEDFGTRAVLGKLDTGYASHGLVDAIDVQMPSYGNHVTVANGLIFLDNVGYPSSLLRPWLAADAVRPELVAGAHRIVGQTGAAVGAATVTARLAGAAVTAPVAADGSFVLALGERETGERVTVQATDGTGRSGNKLRLDLPAGTDGGRLEIPGFGARWSVAGNRAALAAEPAVENGSHLVLVELGAGAPGTIATIDTTGPIGDLVLAPDVLYAGGARLEVFDLATPATPSLAGSLDLFGGRPVLALVPLPGGELAALGAAASGLELKTLSLQSPLVPTVLSTTAVPALASPRLVVAGGALWLLGEGGVSRYLLAAGQPPQLESAGSFPGLRFTDVDTNGGTTTVAVAGQGLRSVTAAGAALSLGPAPGELHPALALVRLPAPGGGERLWWAEGLGGLVTLLRTETPVAGVTLPIHGHLGSRCAVRDAAPVAGDLYLLTDCGIERIDR